MPQLPLLSGRALILVLETIGYVETHQCGSHIRLNHTTRAPVTVPNYSQIDRSLLRKILRDAQLTPSEFVRLAKKGK